jgi:hypothetical protein
MPPASSLRNALNPDELPTVTAWVSYLAPGDGPVQVRVYPPGSGLATARPPSVRREVTIRDARPIAYRLRLDEQGFELRSHRSGFILWPILRVPVHGLTSGGSGLQGRRAEAWSRCAGAVSSRH